MAFHGGREPEPRRGGVIYHRDTESTEKGKTLLMVHHRDTESTEKGETLLMVHHGDTESMENIEY